jgi:hypothetical protein
MRGRIINSQVQQKTKAKEQDQIEKRLAQAYAGEASNLQDEIEELLRKQSWPAD